jgi:hypothetical protein
MGGDPIEWGIETIGHQVKLAARLATARTMATFVRRYPDFDSKAVARRRH